MVALKSFLFVIPIFCMVGCCNVKDIETWQPDNAEEKLIGTVTSFIENGWHDHDVKNEVTGDVVEIKLATFDSNKEHKFTIIDDSRFFREAGFNVMGIRVELFPYDNSIPIENDDLVFISMFREIKFLRSDGSHRHQVRGDK